MAHKVVCFVTKYALLLRERVQLSTLWIIPVGRMHMRQGAFAEALAVSQGVFGEAGMECVRANTHPAVLAPCLPTHPPSDRVKILTSFTLNANMLCALTAFELYRSPQRARFPTHICGGGLKRSTTEVHAFPDCCMGRYVILT